MGCENITGEMLLSQGKNGAPDFLVDDTGLHETHVNIFLFHVLHFPSLIMLDVNVLHGFITPKEAITSGTLSVLSFSE